MAFFSSAASLGSSSSCTSRSSSGSRSLSARSSSSASARISASPPPASASVSCQLGLRLARSALDPPRPSGRDRHIPSTRATNFCVEAAAGHHRLQLVVPRRRSGRVSATRTIADAQDFKQLPRKLGQRHFVLLAAVEIAQLATPLRQLVVAQDDRGRGVELVGPLHALADIAAIAELDGEAVRGAALARASAPGARPPRRPARSRSGAARAGGSPSSMASARCRPPSRCPASAGRPSCRSARHSGRRPAPCPGRRVRRSVNSKAVWQ